MSDLAVRIAALLSGYTVVALMVLCLVVARRTRR